MTNSKNERPWFRDDSYISPWTYKANEALDLPGQVTIYDVTLRDGEQYPGLVFSKEEKVELAQILDDELGINRLEAGMPAVSQDDFDAVKEISKKVDANVVAFCRGMRSDVDLAVDAGVWGALVELPSNEILIKKGYQWEKEDVIEKAVDTCNYAKDKGLHTTFFLIDSSGADPDFLKPIIEAVVSRSDIDSMAAVDTFGRLHPLGTMEFIKSMKEWAGGIPIEIHVHNDFGLATANSLAAVAAGAEVVHTNVLGLGERSGGAPTEEIAVGLNFLYGLDTGIKYEKLMEVAKEFQDVSGIKMPGHKPVIGDNSFSYEVGIAAMFSYRLFKENLPQVVAPYRAEIVGNEFRIPLGKKSGKYSILWHLENIGRDASEEEIKEMVGKVKEKSIKEGRMITNEEFDEIYKEVTS